MKLSSKRNKIAIISSIALLVTAILVWIKVKATPNKTGFFNKLFGSNKLLLGKLPTPEYKWYKVKTAYEFRGFIGGDMGISEKFSVNDYVYGYVSGNLLKTKTRDFETSIPLANVEIVATENVDALIIKPLVSLLERINASTIVQNAIKNQIAIDSLASRIGTYDVFKESNFVQAIVQVNLQLSIDLALRFSKNLEGKYVVVLDKTGKVRNEDLLKSFGLSGLPYSNFDVVVDKTTPTVTSNRENYGDIVLTYDPNYNKNGFFTFVRKVEVYFTKPYSGTSASFNGEPVVQVINGEFLANKVYQARVYYSPADKPEGILIAGDNATEFYLPFTNKLFEMLRG